MKREIETIERSEEGVSPAWLGLGANLGDRIGTLRESLTMIDNLPSTTLREVSSFYLTPPLGPPDQPEYINCAVRIDTRLSPADLLAGLKDIEQKLGRQNRERWREREIDIDILLYGEMTLKEDHLQIPHPELHKRNFVLVPLAEIGPEVYHPVLGKSIRELQESIDTTGIERVKDLTGEI